MTLRVPSLITRLTKYFLVGIVLFCTNKSTAQDKKNISAVQLVKVSNQVLSSIVLSNICGGECNTDTSIFFSPKNSKSLEGIVFAIDEKNKIVRKIRLDRSKWFIDRVWDINNIVNKDQDQDILIGINPVLYPVSKNNFAIAITKKYSQMLSGGIENNTTADFVLLKDSNDSENVALILREIPFSCYVMNRACFNEKEYKSSPHCHREQTGISILKISDIGKEIYQWSFTWKEEKWLEHVSSAQKTTTKYTFLANPFVGIAENDSEKINFCAVD
jgi:hypothetical protein